MGQGRSTNRTRRAVMVLGQLLQTIREEEDVQKICRAIVVYFQQNFTCDVAWIGLYDRLTHQLVGRGGFVPNGKPKLLRQRFKLAAGSQFEQAIIQQRPIQIPDLCAESRMGVWQKVAKILKIHEVVICPVVHQGQCYGVVLLGSMSRLRLTATAQERLTIILGTLATALHHMAVRWQTQRNQHPSQLILRLLSQFHTFPGFEQYLQEVTEAVHQFLLPTRTSIYWYRPEGHFFWRRVSNTQKIPEQASYRPISGLQDSGEFYNVLAEGDLVVIGAAQSSLSTQSTEQLMQKMRVRSVLVAPIRSYEVLLGFIALEHQSPRIWQTFEKNFLQEVSRLLAVADPLSKLDSTVQKIERDRSLTAKVAQVSLASKDGMTALPRITKVLGRRLKAGCCLLLQSQSENPKFLKLLYQYRPANRRRIPIPIKALKLSERRELQKSGITVIQSWDEDQPLQKWRKRFGFAGIRSLLVCWIASQPYALLVVGHELPRNWTADEQEIVKTIGQQIGLILHHYQRDQQNRLHHELTEAMAQGWQQWQTVQQVEELEWQFIQQLARILGSPWAGLITWSAGETQSQVVIFDAQQESPVQTPHFRVRLTDLIQDDPLIQQALVADTMTWVNPTDLAEPVRQWLNSPNLDLVALIPLKIHAEQSSTGIVMVADPELELVSELSINLVTEFVRQMVWQRQILIDLEQIHTQHLTLKQLNWYKQHRLEDLHQTLAEYLEKFKELEQQLFRLTEPDKRQIAHLRYQQLLRQTNQTFARAANILEQEKWHLLHAEEPIPLDPLLKRVRERLRPLVQSHQLLIQLHQNKSLNARGDRFKLELILFELLKLSCERSPSTGIVRIDVAALDAKHLTLKLTDQGRVDPDLSSSENRAILTSSRFDTEIEAPLSLENTALSPTQVLTLCQRLLQPMGGELYAQHLDSGQLILQLILPLFSVES